MRLRKIVSEPNLNKSEFISGVVKLFFASVMH
jgi:hypothetical protein